MDKKIKQKNLALDKLYQASYDLDWSFMRKDGEKYYEGLKEFRKFLNLYNDSIDKFTSSEIKALHESMRVSQDLSEIQHIFTNLEL